MPPLLLAGCGVTAAPRESRGPLEWRPLPGVELGLSDRIESIDLAVAADGDLHVAWTAAVHEREDVLPELVSFHARHDADEGRWLLPRLFHRPRGGALEIVAAPDALHVFSGQNLHHQVSHDDGRSWSTREDLAPFEAPGSLRAAAVLADEAVVVAALVHRPPPVDIEQRSRAHAQELRVFRIPPRGKVQRIRVAEFPASTFEPPAPALYAADGRLHLLVGLNAERREVGDHGAAVAVEGRLTHFNSVDGGRSWSVGEDLPTSGASTLAAVALSAGINAGIDALWSAHGIYLSRSHGDGSSHRSFSPPRLLNPYRTRLGRGDSSSGALAAADADGHGLAVWVDGRYRRGKRSWRNPLGGFPWSDDDPFWANNDLFCLDLEDRIVADVSASALTPPLSYVGSIRLEPANDRWHLLWAGRARVGRRLTDAGEPPTLFHASWPRQEPSFCR